MGAEVLDAKLSIVIPCIETEAFNPACVKGPSLLT